MHSHMDKSRLLIPSIFDLLLFAHKPNLCFKRSYKALVENAKEFVEILFLPLQLWDAGASPFVS